MALDRSVGTWGALRAEAPPLEPNLSQNGKTNTNNHNKVVLVIIRTIILIWKVIQNCNMLQPFKLFSTAPAPCSPPLPNWPECAGHRSQAKQLAKHG